MAVAIRRPIGSHARGDPDRSVARNILPVAVVIQVLVAGHLRRNIIGGFSAIFAMVALKRPIVEIIGARQLCDVIVQLIAASEAS